MNNLYNIEFDDEFILISERVIEVEDAIIGAIKRTLPLEEQRVDVIKYLLNDVVNKIDSANVVL
ncbi:hypothetical protein [Eubacterium barkeri]|uniref:Uncharacterized protein n=1 Tax=Eubacterium barkeri TaxID=1528 RepID=A0A1H3BGU7_EUBBA|nr:hypothetical protein [Eubacterium barkeri]SDX41210.1 hypothetical protein SAMN04488579_10277 [Eubacterium barkeri]